jgi:putative membrane protein
MFHGGAGAGPGAILLVMGLFWLVLIGVIIWLVSKVWPNLGRGGGGAVAPTASASDTPEQILDRMFALGEIDEQTYRTRRTALADMQKPRSS